MSGNHSVRAKPRSPACRASSREMIPPRRRGEKQRMGMRRRGGGGERGGVCSPPPSTLIAKTERSQPVYFFSLLSLTFASCALNVNTTLSRLCAKIRASQKITEKETRGSTGGERFWEVASKRATDALLERQPRFGYGTTQKRLRGKRDSLRLVGGFAFCLGRKDSSRRWAVAIASSLCMKSTLFTCDAKIIP